MVAGQFVYETLETVALEHIRAAQCAPALASLSIPREDRARLGKRLGIPRRDDEARPADAKNGGNTPDSRGR